MTKEQEESALTKGKQCGILSGSRKQTGAGLRRFLISRESWHMGRHKDEALRNVETLALKILTERMEREEEVQWVHDLFHAV